MIIALFYNLGGNYLVKPIVPPLNNQICRVLHHLKQTKNIRLSLLHRMIFTHFMGSYLQKPYMALAPYLALGPFIKKTAKKCAKTQHCDSKLKWL